MCRACLPLWDSVKAAANGFDGQLCLVLPDNFEAPRWQQCVHRLYQLFRWCLLEPELLREFFDERLLPTHSDSRLIDPGHHYEWCWLLPLPGQWLDQVDVTGIGEKTEKAGKNDRSGGGI